MKSASRLSVVIVLFAISMTGLAKPLSKEEQRNRLQTLRMENSKNTSLTLLESAYMDTAVLLGSSNMCGQFFGGSAARRVLEEMIINLRIRRINDSRIAIRMYGTITNFVEPQKGIRFRLFEHAEINSTGAFCKTKVFAAEEHVPNVGSFRPNTREARVLILLHELAHSIQGKDGAWLIPDDGGDPQRSRSNTLMLESKCGAQIRAL